MRHKLAGRKFSRTSEHRKAMFANLALALIEHEQIETTLPKAKDLRRVVEPLITKAKKGDLAARREVLSSLHGNKDLVKKLFDDIAPRFEKRNGGYTRIIKAGHRQGDAADMAYISLTEMASVATSTEEKKPAKKASTAKKSEAKEEKKAVAKKSTSKKSDDKAE